MSADIGPSCACNRPEEATSNCAHQPSSSLFLSLLLLFSSSPPLSSSSSLPPSLLPRLAHSHPARADSLPHGDAVGHQPREGAQARGGAARPPALCRPVASPTVPLTRASSRVCTRRPCAPLSSATAGPIRPLVHALLCPRIPALRRSERTPLPSPGPPITTCAAPRGPSAMSWGNNLPGDQRKPEVVACAMYGPSNVSPPKSEGHSERAIGPNPEAEPRYASPVSAPVLCTSISRRTARSGWSREMRP